MPQRYPNVAESTHPRGEEGVRRMRMTAASVEGGPALNGFAACHQRRRVAGSTISC